MQAETLNCPMCGAAVTGSEATHCLYCKARLATVSCPHCFAMMYTESRHCPRCGTSAAARSIQDTADDEEPNCPRCRIAMMGVMLGMTRLRECNLCNGLWVDVASFERICADREQQSAVLGAAHFAAGQRSAGGAGGKVSYVPCPECGHLMNRVNFARCSGVVVDVCKGHGTWFDMHELSEIVEFIRKGGLDQAREREKAQLEETRRSLQAEQLAATTRVNNPIMNDEERHSGLSHAAGALLKILKDW